jgi:hypothetical protein
MSVRQDVFEYIKNNAGATVDDLKKTFADAKERTLIKYMSDYRAQTKGAKKTAPGKRGAKVDKSSNRQKVFDYLTKNINAKLDDLKKNFPEINKGTMSDYYYRWKRRTDKTKKKATAKVESLKAKVFDYLNENPDTTVPKLQKAFKDAKIGTLRNLRSQWQKLKAPATEETGADKELIKALKKTVEAQEKAIEAMQKTIDIIARDRKDEPYDELEGMSVDRIKKIAATYLRGLRELPESLRRK